MSMQHIFGFDHLPVGALDLAAHYDTRLKNFTGEGAVVAAAVSAGGWVGSGGGTLFQAIIPQVFTDPATHAVIGFRAKLANGVVGATQAPILLYLNSAWTQLFTPAEVIASNFNTAGGDYFQLDINFTTGVIRRWIGNKELSTLTIAVATLKTAWWTMTTQAYSNGYSCYSYRDIYVGDNADGNDVQVLGDRVVSSVPVARAEGAQWSATDGGSLVTALNKAWVSGATDVTAKNPTDNSAIRVGFIPSALQSTVDAVQVCAVGSVASPTTSLKLARTDDATGKVLAATSTIKPGYRSPVYSTKANGSKISVADFAAMNFDISGV